MERCPFCGGQLISCGCCYKHFYPEYNDNMYYDAIGQLIEKQFNGLPEDVYNNGLSDEQEEEWDKVLKAKGLIPYIRYPIVCARCGELWPELFMVPEWADYIEPAQRDAVICRPCYDWIKKIIDAARLERENGQPTKE